MWPGASQAVAGSSLIGLAVGGAVPVGELRDRHSAGVTAGLRFVYEQPSGLDLSLWLDAQRLFARELQGFELAEDMTIFAFGAGVRRRFSRPARAAPYLEAGGGNYRLELPDEFIERKFGVYGRAGVQYSLSSSWALAGDLSFHYVFTDRFIDRAAWLRFGAELLFRL